ncbi:alpha/beta hydrolase [uncultured Ferrimonas sp.]|uniref:alpha/beta fold hydrolase n=1 Tax=uncultured Ferrimonas sp. TaxID=432640 RepID=UPI00262E2DF7|nr:alpha/beta hydrolase [uncultured Ferrimonas sp.]
MSQLLPALQQWQQQGHYFEWQQQRIFYGEQGSGPALVLIHGFPSASWDWQYLLPTLAQHFRVIYFDLLGFGYSDKPTHGYHMAQQADLTEALCAHLGVKQAHLLAHDYGDTVAQELLARQQHHRQQVQWLSCALLNGGLFPESHRPLLIQRLLASPMGPLLGRFFSQRSFNRNLRQIWGNTPPSQPELEGLWQLLLVNNGRAAIPYLIRYMKERIIHRDRWLGALVNADIPLLLINGIEDPISGRSLVERYQALMPDRPVIKLQGVGHYPQLEAPQRVLQQLLPFWQQSLHHHLAANNLKRGRATH